VHQECTRVSAATVYRSGRRLNFLVLNEG